MKFVRLAALTLIGSALSFGASKEIVELQRDVALLQDKMDTMQRDLDTKLGALTAMLQAVQDNSAKSNASLQDALSNGVGKQLAPVSGLSTKVDSMGEDVRALRDALNDLGGRLERMDAKMTDLKNQMQIIQNPSPAPGTAAPGTTEPGAAPGAQQPQQGNAAAPPAGMTAEKTYTDARRDLQTGNADLALQEFQQYLTYFPNTELAANAQYYIGEILFRRSDYNNAIPAFDAVLERYPENPKTADAHFMKGMALLKAGQRNRAVQEFRTLVANYPRTDDARKAQQQLRQLGASASSAPTATRRRPQ
ncbi:MAG: tol-pal system protein YbgF [Bryobacteraceae bacterium]